MRTGRPIAPLMITHAERETLERSVRRPTTVQALAQRARIILRCAGGKTNTQVAHELRLMKQTVGKWRNLMERWFALLTEKQLRRGVHSSTQALKAAILADIKLSKEHPKPFILDEDR